MSVRPIYNDVAIDYGHDDLVGGWATPLKNMISSIGMMKLPIFLGKCQKWQPNHQPVIVLAYIFSSDSVIVFENSRPNFFSANHLERKNNNHTVPKHFQPSTTILCVYIYIYMYIYFFIYCPRDCPTIRVMKLLVLSCFVQSLHGYRLV